MKRGSLNSLHWANVAVLLPVCWHTGGELLLRCVRRKIETSSVIITIKKVSFSCFLSCDLEAVERIVHRGTYESAVGDKDSLWGRRLSATVNPATSDLRGVDRASEQTRGGWYSEGGCGEADGKIKVDQRRRRKRRWKQRCEDKRGEGRWEAETGRGVEQEKNVVRVALQGWVSCSARTTQTYIF